MLELPEEDQVIRSIADKLEKSYAAVRLVSILPDYGASLIAHASGNTYDEEPEDAHITAAQLCETARHYAYSYFGEDWAGIMKMWGVRTSEDIGVIVYELVRAGYIMISDSDSPEDFHGLRLF
ncbi:MAG: hypothetical protein AAF085_10850 [Planctomycetota bacterium]